MASPVGYGISVSSSVLNSTTSFSYMDHSLFKVNRMIAEKNRLHRFNEHWTTFSTIYTCSFKTLVLVQRIWINKQHFPHQYKTIFL